MKLIRPLKLKKFLPKYKSLMDNIQEMVIIFNTVGKIIDCNEQGLKELGYGEEIFNLPVNTIFRNAFTDTNNPVEFESKYAQKPVETIAYRKNETCLPVILKIAMCKEKSFQYGLCTAINIADKKEAIREAKYCRNELRTMDQLNNEMIANVTHELRTPINGIMGFSNSLLEANLSPKQIEDIKIILRCCTNMSDIVNNILDYTKLTNRNLELEQREFNFRGLINQIVEVNEIHINEKGLNLLVNISAEIPETVVGDELRLSQVLNNLFSNAIKFTAVGQISLEVTKVYESDTYIELFFMIIDSGIGIGPEDKDKLFKSFSQVDNSITRVFGGTGLGLSICKRLIEAMGGAIQVESEKHKGSTFSFSVRLGLLQQLNAKVNNILLEDAYKEKELDQDSIENEAIISEFDFVNMKLMASQMNSGREAYNQETIKNVARTISQIMEKIVICIEMENWSKAEELVFNVRKMIPQDQMEVSKKLLGLLLNIRNEKRENSLLILKELEESIPKEV